ncbi:camphor resistance protein CrcB [Williamsia limnetica]|jgi:CrcB protein|uniref:Fluoride-specific ion channel FluC n=1 Tax=Williamsia limnetica TaxID=882452 RepID=A0A318S0C1_WILLI|nr:fluoride efflux transporter CrcB [Williamsia limnetica]PYE16434.1 camphor resistance protein CrcB [Williamsia limnetica]
MIVWVALAGAFGAVARFMVDSEFKRRRPSPLPWGTGVINVTGSLIIGVIAGIIIFHGGASEWQAIVGTGFCGGYTTFSTASFETVRLIQQGRRGMAVGYATGSLVISVAACAAGLALVHAV